MAKLEKTLPNPETGNPYEKLRNKIKQSLPTQEEQALRPIPIPQVATKPGESTSNYAARLREKATDCEFGDTHDDRILEHIIQTIENKTLIQKAINKAWDLSQFLIERDPNGKYKTTSHGHNIPGSGSER